MGKFPKNFYAPSRSKQNWTHPGVDWGTVALRVNRLQMRIAKAAKAGQWRKMRSLQWLLAHSFFAKLLAVKRVTTNKGRRTAGVDGVLWNSPHKKMQAVTLLTRRGYRPQPLRRVYIEKKSGKLRPLGIPTMRDRAMQALYELTLAPVAETLADPNSYGFRKSRSCADAIAQCFGCLSRRYDPQWILEADIKSCFDEISHKWLLENIPVDRKVLESWLKAGYMDKGKMYPTLQGTPQGGIISPVLMNMTLDGLERVARESVPTRHSKEMGGATPAVNVVRYADDFIITARSKELLTERVKPAIERFLEQRGLTLSPEKTRVVHISEGFDFLGQRLRKFNGKLIIKPTRKAVQGLQAKVTAVLKAHLGKDTWSMIARLNPIIRGWTNYHKHVCSSKTFGYIDSWMYKKLRSWIYHRHSNKGRKWGIETYFRATLRSRWTFYAQRKNPEGKKVFLDLRRACQTSITRHIKVKANANPFEPQWTVYFTKRKLKQNTTMPAKGSRPQLAECGWSQDRDCL